MTARSPRNAASEAQFRAARPDASTWLAANAGSGKTKVLTDRVVRLLLRGCPTTTHPVSDLYKSRRLRDAEPPVQDDWANGPCWGIMPCARP